MFRGILADKNIEGHVDALIEIWESPQWNSIWTPLEIILENFDNLELLMNASDSLIWRSCKTHGLVLITANRNNDGPDSLESTIRQFNTPTSLPVLTIASPERFDKDRSYATEVAERILDRLLNIENYLGTGRLFV